MNTRELADLEAFMTLEERVELDALIAADIAENPWLPLDGPQTLAFDSAADITGYGGAAGGGKTDLMAGLTITRHYRTLIARREKAQTEGVIQRMTAILGNDKGLNGQKGIWKLGSDKIVEFAGLDNPGDERRWQGRDHDLKAFDEVTEMREYQVRFVMGWNRSARNNVKGRVLMTFNPPTTPEGRWVLPFFGPWLDKTHPLYPTAPGELRWCAMLPQGDGTSKDTWFDTDGIPLTARPFVLVNGYVIYDFEPKSFKPEDIIQPRSRTFIPARLTDNPYYMKSGYMSVLQAMEEPLRSQMLHGDFNAGIEDSEWQVIPTAWVEAAVARWQNLSPKPPMDSLGVDVARGGRDKTILQSRHGMWFDKPTVLPGSASPDGPTVAGLAIVKKRDNAVIHIDVIGVGASPYDFLVAENQDVQGINVSRASSGRDKSGAMEFFNLRTELVWRAREAFDPDANTGIAIPPDPQLIADLCAFTWRPKGRMIYVESREEVVKRIGRSPDHASAFFLALIDTPKRGEMRRLLAGAHAQRAYQTEHDPMACMQQNARPDYDPFAFNR